MSFLSLQLICISPCVDGWRHSSGISLLLYTCWSIECIVSAHICTLWQMLVQLLHAMAPFFAHTVNYAHFLMSHCVHWHLSPSLHMLTHWIMPVLYNYHHPTPSPSLSPDVFMEPDSGVCSLDWWSSSLLWLHHLWHSHHHAQALSGGVHPGLHKPLPRLHQPLYLHITHSPISQKRLMLSWCVCTHTHTHTHKQQFTDIISTHSCCIPTDRKLYNIFHVIVVLQDCANWRDIYTDI